MADAQQLAQRILDTVGGSANIADVENCMTRLRVEVVSTDAVSLEELKATDGVIAALAAGSNLQIVLGPGLVDRVAVDLEALRASGTSAAGGGAGAAGASASSGASGASPEELAARGASIKASARSRADGRTMRAIRRVSAIFIPLIPALIACGLIAGINGILTNLHWLPGVTPFLGVLSSGFLSLLAVFVAMNAAKEFGGTPILVVQADGSFELPDGRTFDTPSRAAREAAQVPTVDGWRKWTLPDGRKLDDLWRLHERRRTQESVTQH